MKCYLCGSVENLTRDHIPPKGFFPPPLPANLLTIPCCFKCNNSFSKDDEAVRMWLSCQLGNSSAAQWIFENRVLKNTVVRAPSLRETLLSTMKEVILPTVDGNISVTQFEIPRERVEQFVIRVTKGLITKYFPEHDYFDAVFSARHIPSTLEGLMHLEPTKNMLSYDCKGTGVFEFRYGLTDSGQSGVWILVFYECAIFLVVHTKNNWGKPSA